MRRVGSVVCVLSMGVLSLAACGGSPQAPAAASASKSWDCSTTSSLSQAEWVQHCAGTNNSTTSPAVDTEGSVRTADGSFIQYPNGLRGKIAAVKARPNDAQHPTDAHPEFNELVTVTFQLSNTGHSLVKLNTDAMGTSQLDLYYGQNRYQANGWQTDRGVQDLPQQLAPGTSATFDSDFTMPSSGMNSLAVTFQPEGFTPYTFTDVQTLLH